MPNTVVMVSKKNSKSNKKKNFAQNLQGRWVFIPDLELQ